VLLLVGLVGLYVRQSEASGILGLVGFAVAFLGTALVLGAVWAQLFVAPFLAIRAPAVLDAEPTGTLAMGFTLVYSGEHYVVDVLAGWLYVVMVCVIARWWENREAARPAPAQT
jgi:hypothetical protein